MSETDGPDGAQPMGGVSDEDLGARVAAGQRDAGVGVGATSVDPQQLLEQIQQLQAKFARLEADKRGAALPVLTAAADQVADLMAAHASGRTTREKPDHGEGLRLAADLQEAAKNAVDSGDVSAFSQIGERIHRFLKRNHPGPGDHPYYAQAVDRAAELGDIADAFEPDPGTPQVTSSRKSTPVLSGSVVG
jgi:hypothetical protein